MDNETQKIIEEQIRTLPKDVREAITSVNYQAKLQEITKRQKLLIDQAGKLEMETTLVMIGLEPLADYIGNLQRELNIPIMHAKEIAMDVDENIFKPIRNTLKSMSDHYEEWNNPSLENNNPLPKENNVTDLNRNQILSEIENPNTINGGDMTMNFTKPEVPKKEESTVITIKTPQEIETVPGQEVKNVEKVPEPVKVDILQAKMSGVTVTPQQIIEAKPEVKLPEIEKKRPSSGVDPYREPLM